MRLVFPRKIGGCRVFIRNEEPLWLRMRMGPKRETYCPSGLLQPPIPLLISTI